MSVVAKVEPSTTANTQPRKRRRRAPATGAADDCFTCSTQQAKCDRRRPYCSQCLDSGKDCSGYKTALTWGVGVASRGKLRGLSLPVAGNQKTQSNSPASRKRPSVSDVRDSQKPRDGLAGSFMAHSSAATNPSPTITTFGFVNATSSASPAVSSSGPTWSTPAPTAAAHADTKLETYPHVRRLGLPTSNPYQDTTMPTTTSSIAAYSDTGYESPLTYSTSSKDSNVLAVPASNHDRAGTHKDWTPMLDNISPLDDRAPSPWPRDSLSSRIGSSLSTHEFADPMIREDTTSHPTSAFLDQPGQTKVELGDEIEAEETFYGDGIIGTDLTGQDVANHFPRVFYDEFPEPAFALSPSFAMSSIGKTPRLQYLISYYAEVIAPVIVAFDGPTNPYKTHILSLAMESETLQHAIAALSASNLRQRRENSALSTGKTDPARRSSMAHCAMTDEVWQQQLGLLSPEDQAREELYHKGFSIQALNAQLADPSRRRDDSILATLLILCLFHICDTGVAKFKTQFAGVKKLLALRGNETNNGSREMKWFTRMFTWFDAMTATVNNREGQLQGVHLDISSLSDEEWALENLAGCDGRLFKMIAKLGRLNVLSQNKPVDETPTVVSRPFPASLNNNTCNRFDGNGWATLLADEDLFNAQSITDSQRTQFWREWRELRTSLTEWALDPAAYTTTFDPHNLADLSNISESFRYSALLYTERLAFPNYPSSHPNIQNLVQKALHFIKMVRSDVYLLWPLFVTGSECVDEQHRQVIRQRCLDIQKDSGFFNNISCLELLERVWRSNTPGLVEEVRSGGINEGFKWRNVMNMEKSEGEYIVV